MQENYLIGHVAHLLSISKDTLRYYDKLGIVSPKKSPDNGYRYYTLEDLLTLSYVLVLRDLEIPLESIKHFIQHNTLEDFAHLLEQQEAFVDEKMDKLLKLKEKVTSFKEQIHIAQHLHGKIQLAYNPPFVSQYTKKEWDANYASYLAHMENNPNIAAPIFSIFIDKDFLINKDEQPLFSFGITGIVKDLGSLEAVATYHYMAPCLCMHTVVQAKETIYPYDLEAIRTYIKDKNITLCGDLIARNIAFEYRNELPTDYYEIWLPIKEKV